MNIDLYKFFQEKFQMPEDIFDFFQEYFYENTDILNKIFEIENIFLEEIYFKEILSWEFYPEIRMKNCIFEWKDLKNLYFSIKDSKSELVPVLYFRYKNIDNPRGFHLELHKSWNPF